MASLEKAQILWEINGQTFHLTLDTYSNRSLDMVNEVTEHPVEEGSSVVDHIRPLPDVISIAGLVSNQPCFIPLDYAEGANSLEKVTVNGARRTIGNTIKAPIPQEIALIPGVPVGIPIGAALIERIPLPGYLTTATTYKPNVAFDRPKSVTAALQGLRAQRTLVTLNTRLIRYDNLAIQTIKIEESGPRYCIMVAITFKEVRVGRSVTVEIPTMPTERKSQSTKTTKPKAVEEPEQASSVLNNMFGARP